MSASSSTSQPKGQDDVVPLLPDSAKNFLDGGIDTSQYVTITCNTANARVRNELHMNVMARSARRPSGGIIVLASVAYAILGGVSVQSNKVLGIVSIATALAFLPIGVRLYLKHRHRSARRQQDSSSVPS